MEDFKNWFENVTTELWSGITQNCCTEPQNSLISNNINITTEQQPQKLPPQAKNPFTRTNKKILDTPTTPKSIKKEKNIAEDSTDQDYGKNFSTNKSSEDNLKYLQRSKAAYCQNQQKNKILSDDQIIDKKVDENFLQMMNHNDGSVYTGQVLNGRKNGKGTQVWQDRSKYIGEWEDDVIKGKGTFYYPNGDVFEALWDNNSANGYGTYKSKINQFIYEGTFLDGQKNGHGTENNSLEKYNGEFKKGKKDGWGQLF